ncbi:MAG: hypothetical protein RR387_02780 [Clostridiales bacterium]
MEKYNLSPIKVQKHNLAMADQQWLAQRYFQALKQSGPIIYDLNSGM